MTAERAEAERDALAARIDAAMRPLVIYESTDGQTTRKVLADDALRLQSVLRECRAALAALAAPSPPVAQPAEPCKPCDNVDQFGQECHLHKGHVGNHRRAPAEPPATEDLVARLRDMAKHGEKMVGYATLGDELYAQAADMIERQAREIAEWKRKYGDANEWGLIQTAAWKDRAERAEAERDAMREVVKAADEVRLGLDCPMCDSGELRNPAKGHWDTCSFANYDAARAKVKP